MSSRTVGEVNRPPCFVEIPWVFTLEGQTRATAFGPAAATEKSPARLSCSARPSAGVVRPLPDGNHCFASSPPGCPVPKFQRTRAGASWDSDRALRAADHFASCCSTRRTSLATSFPSAAARAFSAAYKGWSRLAAFSAVRQGASGASMRTANAGRASSQWRAICSRMAVLRAPNSARFLACRLGVAISSLPGRQEPSTPNRA